eukprot:COSAG01_NODE_1079_length_11822_cov_4.368762_13_plen_119_part_00
MRPTYALQAAAYAQAVEEMEGADVVKCVVVRIGKKPGDWCVLCTGAGEDNGIDHRKNWLRFPYDSTLFATPLSPPAPVAGSVLCGGSPGVVSLACFVCALRATSSERGLVVWACPRGG